MVRKRASKVPASPRGKLRSMRVSDGFRDFVLEQMSGVAGLRARAMFGGVGLYAGEVFFGILAADVLYLKVDDTNRGWYEREGTRPFRPYPEKPMAMPYYEVPVGILEDRKALAEWAEASVHVATRVGENKKKRR
jgi:DNA transformation protein